MGPEFGEEFRRSVGYQEEVGEGHSEEGGPVESGEFLGLRRSGETAQEDLVSQNLMVQRVQGVKNFSC